MSAQKNVVSTEQLMARLEDCGKSRQIFAETDRLFLTSATVLDILFHTYEASTLSALAENIQKKEGEKALAEIETFRARFENPKEMLWIMSVPESPFGQVSFLLKDGRYIGRCRFYPPEGEEVSHLRGGDSGGPQGLPIGIAEMSFHFLDQFTGQGYGSEGLKKAIEVLIHPAIGKHPLYCVGAHVSAEGQSKKPDFKPTQHPFKGLGTTTGLVNLASIKAGVKAGLVPGRFVETEYNTAGLPGYLDFRYPNPSTTETKILQEFLKGWIEITEKLGREYMENPYVMDETGMGYFGFKPELLIHYHRLKRTHNVGIPRSDEDLRAHEKFVGITSFGTTYGSKLEKIVNLFIQRDLDLKPVDLKNGSPDSNKNNESTTISNLIWQYVGSPLDISDQIAQLPPLTPAKAVTNKETVLK